MKDCLIDIAEDDERPLFPIEAKDKDPAPEEDRQRAFLNALKTCAPKVMAYANVNAGKRTQWAAQKAKREGLRSGVADVTCVWDGGCAWIEFKNGQVTFPLASKATDRAQVEFLDGLVKRGHHAAVFRTAEAALRWLREAGAPVMMR